MAAELGENAIDIALEVARALIEVGAEYFLGGSLASSLQGEPRAAGSASRRVLAPVEVGRKAAFLRLALRKTRDIQSCTVRMGRGSCSVRRAT